MEGGLGSSSIDGPSVPMRMSVREMSLRDRDVFCGGRTRDYVECEGAVGKKDQCVLERERCEREDWGSLFSVKLL